MKPAKEIRAGDQLELRIGTQDWTVRVLQLSDMRGAAPVAQLLSAETPESVTRRAEQSTLRKLAGRSRIREAFLAELEDELRSLNWLLVWRNEIEYGVFHVAKLEGWPKLSSKRVNSYADLCDEHDLRKMYIDLAAEDLNNADEDAEPQQ